MQNEELIDIAIGASATSRSWKNQKWTWRKIVKKLTTERKTSETSKEFWSLNKEDRSAIKDVGGYVGGYLLKGRRNPQNVLHRQILTLDIDFATINFWESFLLMFDCAAVMHSTHSHTKEKPKFRLIIPVSRECTSDEYTAVSRYVAGILGIDKFDKTTFQINRLMFWPSNSRDTRFISYEQKGSWLDVDSILDSYTDWKDSSSWPTSENEIDDIKKDVSKQEDPLSKKGIVGAFNRSYSITELIENHLSEFYEASHEGRYTYTKGSTSSGLVIYDDLFAYSHHGSDPCSGKLCNAFDLMRIHKFGHLDTSEDQGSKAKSFKLMSEFCLQDSTVKRTIATEKREQARYEFADEVEEDFADIEDDDLEWLQELELDAKGKYLSSAQNITLILANDKGLKGAFRENIFDNKKYLWRSVPWRAIKRPEPLKNVDLSGVRNYLESVYGVSGVTKIEDSLNLEFEKYQYHPIRDYLNSLEWDGKERIKNLLADYFGVKRNLYTEEVLKKSLTAAVARVFEPGIKFDLVLVLVGDENRKNQGTGKSTFISILGKEWFSDSFHTMEGQKAFESLQGAWLIEMAELSGLRKDKIEIAKHFITKQEDIYRPAYGRIVETFKRQCVFFATTNKKEFLKDQTGNRRFMPIDVNEDQIKMNVWSGSLEKEVDQIWAEALDLYKNKEPLYLSQEAEKIANVEQVKHSQHDERTGIIDNYLSTLLPTNWPKMDLIDRRDFLGDNSIEEEGEELREFVCIAEIWCECFGKSKNEMDRYKTRELNEIMRGLHDWEYANSTRNFKLYGVQKYYRRKILM